MKKKIFTLFLALVASVGTIFAWDYERVQIGDLYYNLDAANQTAEVTSENSNYPYGSTTITTANIPASVTYDEITYSVTSIGNNAFYECTGLTSVTIGNSVTSIGSSAFYGCSSLTSVTIPNSVTSIGDHAFFYCTGLTSVTIPNSVTSIGDAAFYGCSGLTSVTINSNLLVITFDNNMKDIFGEQVTNYIIGKDVTSIEDYAFAGCTGLTSVTIPNSVTSIGERAFYYCTGLTSVTIPNSVTSIGDYAFWYCSSLTSVTIPNSVTSIGRSAFNGCSSLTSVTIGNSVTSIGDAAFYRCSSLTSVVWNAKNCSTSGEFGSQVKSFVFGSEVEKIPAFCCSGMSNLTSVTIGNSVTSIEYCAFYGCTGLTSLTIPNSVTSIGGYAFEGCSRLTSVTIEAETPPTLGEEAFYDTNNCPIYVPCSTLDAYKMAPMWDYYADRIRGNCASSYTVRFLNWDGSVLQSTQVEEGKIPQYTGTTPTKPSDEEFSYIFSGWTPQIVAATADATYTATFKSIGDHNITVRLDPSSCSGWSTVRLWAWTDEGNIFDSWPGQIVSKDSEGWYSYTFEEDITSVNIIWNNGTYQTVEIEGVTSSTCYALNSTSGKAISVSIVDCVTGQPLGHADETTTTDVTATPNEDNSVTLTWPAVNGADTYTIEIKKNDVLVCTLVFNANGQLISINFAAPARDGKGRNIPAAEQSANGWTYVLTGLEGNASYTYSVTAKDVNGNVLLKQSVDFSTGSSQGIEDVLSDQVQCTKVIRDGQVFILRGEKVYNAQGALVK